MTETFERRTGAHGVRTFTLVRTETETFTRTTRVWQGHCVVCGEPYELPGGGRTHVVVTCPAHRGTLPAGRPRKPFEELSRRSKRRRRREDTNGGTCG